ncbi:glycoside hydrolase family 5 protein [Bacillus sp. FSL K6-3431]|uniref:glycoside hydrolase family 5 protein n=1 Tax=Bacillus sp. FSL K6-3431 TaxID=2921500 RepID=UPI0030F4ED99
MADTIKRLGIGIRENSFTDIFGRQVLLHGINMVCKDAKQNYIGDWGEDDFKKIQSWGFNVIRFGVIWDGLEPEPGSYNDSYIEELRHLIQLAHKKNLYIILDMHQDLYSSVYASGAPYWATFTDGETYEPGHVWSDAYLFNGAVHRAFDHFWSNTPAPDEIGIQDHFVQAWGYLVEKLHNEPNIIGYDIINEPFVGSPALQVNEKMFAKYAEMYSNRYGDVDTEELFAAWVDPQKKHDYLRLLEDVDAFKQVVDAPSQISHPFEQSTLSLLYRKVADTIRENDKQGILFLETNYFSNLGTPSMIEPVENAKGDRDQLQAYAPHAYDLVTDTHLAHTANDKRLEFIINRHEQTRQRLDMPMLIGEWGAFYDSDKTAHVSVHIQHIMEQLLCSDTYWHYTPQMDSSLSFLGVCRGYPMAVTGRLLQYRYEHSLKSYHMKWDETNDSDVPTIVYLPDIRKITDDSVTLDPDDSLYTIHPIEDSYAGLMEIPPITDGIRSLVIVGAKE